MISPEGEDARERFEALYERLPQWETGRPQPALAALAAAGEIPAPAIDAGCGSGETVLDLLARGIDAWGVNVSPTAIGLARAKALARGLPAARFLVGDALLLGDLGMRFASVVDSGLFHSFDDHERELYRQSVAAVLRPGGRLHVLAFADRELPGWGPRRVTAAELRAAFAVGFRELALVATRFELARAPGFGEAWLASFEPEGVAGSPTTV